MAKISPLYQETIYGPFDQKLYISGLPVECYANSLYLIIPKSSIICTLRFSKKYTRISF